jgi:hypothetical protein
MKATTYKSCLRKFWDAQNYIGSSDAIVFQMQIEFNKNLAQTLNEKKKELRQLKEIHYGEITSLKHKMNDAVSAYMTSWTLLRQLLFLIFENV